MHKRRFANACPVARILYSLTSYLAPAATDMIASLHKSTFVVALATGLMLLVPLVAMQVTDEVNWSLGDFVVAGGLLFGTGMTYVICARLARRASQRAAIAAACLCGLGLLWAQLAVGIFK